MKRQKYYFCKELFDEEYLYGIEGIIQQMKGEHINEVIIEEGKRELGAEVKWCNEMKEYIDDTTSGCGKCNCSFYTPRNGKNGCCKYLGHTFMPSGKFFNLTIDGKLKRRPFEKKGSKK